MEITTKEQAFQVLEENQHGIPFEAIEFLYNHPTDEEILTKIQFALDNASNSLKKEDINNLVLWYAIVAENHLDIRLLDSIISLVTLPDGSEFLDEQVSVLIGLMGKKNGSVAVEKTLSAIVTILEDKNRLNSPYLYLFDILFYADSTKQEETIIKILEHPNNEYAIPFAITIGYAGIKALIPQLKNLIQEKREASDDDFFGTDILLPELTSIVKQLESGKIEDPKDMIPYSEQREGWKNYYQEYEDHFEDEEEEDRKNFLLRQLALEEFRYSNYQDIETVKNVEKIGRNEPCPCGSGKKYKKCCLKNN